MPKVFLSGKARTQHTRAILVDAAWKKQKGKDKPGWVAAMAWTEDNTGGQHGGSPGKSLLRVLDKLKLMHPLQAPADIQNITQDIIHLCRNFDRVVCVKVQRDMVRPAPMLATAERRA
uniref:Uncharacterized protein n=1 Tax=Chenopodium quinoa TaxID=63459 RepID=A0A803LJ39_CHEQI